jgi:hypothetical protein
MFLLHVADVSPALRCGQGGVSPTVINADALSRDRTAWRDSMAADRGRGGGTRYLLGLALTWRDDLTPIVTAAQHSGMSEAIAAPRATDARETVSHIP